MAILGIEGGGTRTTALWVDASLDEVRRATFGCGNVQLLDDAALERLFRAVYAAGVGLDVVSVCAGMAGLTDKTQERRVLRALGTVFGSIPLRAVSDLQTPLYADRLDNPASIGATVLVLAGTGSCCYGEADEGKIRAKKGGWGHLLGDRGSAYRIGYLALRESLQWLDNTGKLPIVGQKILSFQLLNTPREWIQWVQKAGKAEIAALAQVVCGCAEECPVAKSVLNMAARELAQDAVACARELGHERVRFLFSGGLLKKSAVYCKLVQDEILQQLPQAGLAVLTRESIWGAVAIARAACNVTTVSVEAGKSSSPMKVSAAASSTTEQRNPRSMQLDKLSIPDAVQLMIEEEQYTYRALLEVKPLITKLVESVSHAFKAGGRLFYVGAGTSGRLGVLDASECPPTFGVEPTLVQGIIAGGYEALWRAAEGAEDFPQAGAEAVKSRGVSDKDVIVGIAASGTTPFVKGALLQARALGAKTALLCFNTNREPYLEGDPDIVLAVPTGPEILTGSTRLKSGTATKLILNMVTTLAMVQNGKVLSNLMIDVRATNDKLRDRAIRITCRLTGWERAEAQSALETHGWSIREVVAGR